MLTGDVEGLVESLEDERKIPVKLRRREHFGEDSWLEELGKMGLGDPGLVLVRAGADMGLEGRLNGPLLKKVLVGLAERQLRSPWTVSEYIVRNNWHQRVIS